MPLDLNQPFNFLLELDALKCVNRRSYINCGERVENSAEHSWHLAMACWALARYLNRDYDLERLFKLALVHDLGEIDAGDTFLYDANRAHASAAERDCVRRLAAMPGNPVAELVEIWDEQEKATSREAQFLKVVDRLLPFMHNLASEGRAWREHGIRKSQVLTANRAIGEQEPDLYPWFLSKVDFAVEQGWLIDD